MKSKIIENAPINSKRAKYTHLDKASYIIVEEISADEHLCPSPLGGRMIARVIESTSSSAKIGSEGRNWPTYSVGYWGFEWL